MNSRNNNNSNRSRLIALFVALASAVGTYVVLTMLYLTYLPGLSSTTERTWPPVDSSELLFADEFVITGDMSPVTEVSEPAPVAESAPAHEATDLENAGEKAPEPAPVLTSERPSPAKVKKKPKPEKTGPSKEEIAAREKAKKEKETARNISDRVNFGKATAGGNGDGGSDSPAGERQGARNGMASGKLGGRSLEKWAKPAATATGTITVTVRVDRNGRVTSARYSGGTGAVASLPAARTSCERAAMQSQFSVDLNGPASQVGSITYRFK